MIRVYVVKRFELYLAEGWGARPLTRDQRKALRFSKEGARDRVACDDFLRVVRLVPKKIEA